MKVHELIEILQDIEPDADVWLMTQENYPFEHRIAGVARRGDWAEPDEDEEADEVGEAAECARGGDRWGASESQLPANDVFIVEGGQVRYGARAAWDAARRW